jgi:hypothetical protein
MDGAAAANANGEPPDLADLLGESPDQRFRLRCFLTEADRTALAEQISGSLIPKVRAWIQSTFPGEPDLATALRLAIEEKFQPDIDKLSGHIMQQVVVRVRDACQLPPSNRLPETHQLSTSDRTDFILRFKKFLNLDEGSISPALEKARVRGRLKSTVLPEDAQLVVTDGEGIGHDAKEAKVLSARHFDYFYVSDGIILVEDAETPFTRGGQSALAALAQSGYLPKLHLAFSRLDKVQAEKEGREPQKKEVGRGLRNALNALKADGVHIEKHDLDVRFFSHMDAPEADEESRAELASLVQSIIAKHGKAKRTFVAPEYDFELLAGYLASATDSMRRTWAGYIVGEGAEAAKWQTQRAFTKRMDRKIEEFRYLKPVAEFRLCLAATLESFLSKPIRWTKEITDGHKRDCLERLKQEVSQQILAYVRSELLEEEHPDWNRAAELSGTGSTPIRSRFIMEVIRDSAPDLTGDRAKAFKDSIKQVIENSFRTCTQASP